MIDLTYLVAGAESESVPHRYGRPVHGRAAARAHRVATDAALRRPVVVWNITRSCNLRCVHCYSDSAPQRYEGELDTATAKHLLRDLALYGVPAVLFSGGEPLVRPDVLPLAVFASELGLRVVLSTNGTLIDDRRARRIRDAGFVYVGVSLDGARATHDRFRGSEGAFDRAVAAIRRLKQAGQKVGVRLTLTAYNAGDVPAVFDLADREGIDRICFYHLVPAGRGVDAAAMPPERTREVMDRIIAETEARARADCPIEVLTVDNPCDGPYLVLRLSARGRAADAARAGELLRWNGGARNGSGVGLACVGPRGDVHPDQFWTSAVLGNVRERPFSQIWSEGGGLLALLRSREGRIRGRCARCRWFEMCGGGFRARAANATGDPWASDPGCYLRDEEIVSPHPCAPPAAHE